MVVVDGGLITQLCPVLCDHMDFSPPGSSVHGIFQARVLEWDAIAFSCMCITEYMYIATEHSESVSCSVVSNSSWAHELWPNRLLYPGDSPGKNTGVCSHSLFQGFLLTQGWNPSLQHCCRFFTVWVTSEALSTVYI